MAINQIFITLLDGTTRCLQFPSPIVSGDALKRHLSLLTGIPASAQRLVTGSLNVHDETPLSASAGFFPSCTLLLRLRAGKGGFGSLLRGAATKAGQKKTNNFDACRDMSGRRLRHVNAEKKLEEWKAEAEDRKLEKLAEQFLKKKAKEVKKNSPVDVGKYLEKYRSDSAKCMEEVEESVRQSFELYKGNKRKILPTSEPSKRVKIWLGKNKMEDSESEDDGDSDEDGGDEESVVLDDGSKEEGGTSGTASQSDGETSRGGLEESNLEGVSGDGSPESGDSVEAEMGVSDNADVQCEVGLVLEVIQETEEADGIDEAEEMCHGPELAAAMSLEEAEKADQIELAKDKLVEPEVVIEGPVARATDVEEPLNFDFYNSAAELEVIGLERLKSELQSKGLKCGGTLQERAARLFLLKTTPLEKLPKKLLAKLPTENNSAREAAQEVACQASCSWREVRGGATLAINHSGVS